MGKSLDELLEFLVEEIAITGDRGTTFAELSESIDTFYTQQDKYAERRRFDPFSDPPVHHSVRDDSKFLSAVWKWLAQHPDISIGPGRKFNDASLTSIEAKFPGFSIAPVQTPTPSWDENTGQGLFAQDDAVVLHGNPRRAVKGPRFHSTTERIYQAICGHSPDAAPVSQSEYILLSHIAAARSEGILQGELVRATGQDKRSVPKRTDALSRRGYIVKEEVFMAGTRTSKLTLSKFAEPTPDEKYDPTQLVDVRHLTIQQVFDTILEVLRTSNGLSQQALEVQVGFEGTELSTVLSKILHHLDQMGCIQYSESPVHFSEHHSVLELYVRLLRRPTHRDMRDLGDAGFPLSSTVADQVAALTSQQITPQSEPSELRGGVARAESEQPTSEFLIPKWNPDRPLTNVLQQLASLSQMKGFTNYSARSQITGPFIRRTVESHLTQISFASLTAQPPHLRHLAVIRTHTTNRGVMAFTYFALTAFQTLSASGDIDGEGVKGLSESIEYRASRGSDASQPLVTRYDVDGFGFPKLKRINTQSTSGLISIEHLISDAGAKSIPLSSQDISIVFDDDGAPSLGKSHQQIVSQPAQRSKPSGHRKPFKKREPTIIIGRPRKFLRGTEKFWQGQFWRAKLNADPKTKSKVDKAGVMSHPAGLKLFASRPEGFDELLLEVLEVGLPVPIESEDITLSWMKQMRQVLDRKENALYVSPLGTQMKNYGRPSQHIILRSSRLSQLGMAERKEVPAVRFISTSISHSLPATRHYPQSFRSPMKTRSTFIASTDSPARPAKRVKLTKTAETTSRGPQMGKFFEKIATAASTTAASMDLSAQTVSKDAANIEVSTDTDEDTIRRRSSMAPVKTRDLPKSKPVQRKVQPASSAKQSTRSTRTRRPTQKAAEAQETVNRFTTGQPIDNTPEIVGEETMPEPVVQRHIPAPEYQTSIPETQHVTTVRSPTLDPTNEIRGDTERRDELQQEPSQISAPSLIQLDRSGTLPDPSPAKPPDEPVPTQSPVPASPKTPNPAKAISAHRTGRAFSYKHRPRVQRFKLRPQETHDEDEEEADIDVEQSDSDSASSRKAGMNQRQVSKFCRETVMALVHICAGIAPYDASIFRRAMARRWQEAGQEDKPNLRAVKNALKLLRETGKIKQMTFSFQSKNGTMIKRAILTLPEIEIVSNLDVEDLKQNMMDSDILQYTPPEWTAECKGKSAGSPEKRSNLPDLRSTKDPNMAVDQSSDVESHRKKHAADVFLTLKVPGLHKLACVQEHDWRLNSQPRLHFSPIPTSRRASLLGLHSSNQPNKSKRRYNRRNLLKWKTPAREALVRSLQSEVERMRTGENGLDTAADLHPLLREVNAIMEQESALEDQTHEWIGEWTFINHLSTDLSCPPSTVEPLAWINVHVGGQGEEQTEIPNSCNESWSVFADALQEPVKTHNETISSTLMVSCLVPDKIPQSLQQKRKRQTRIDDEDFIPGPKRARKSRAVAAPNRQTSTTERIKQLGGQLPFTTLPEKRTRAPRVLGSIPDDTIYRMTVAVVCVRTLTGGLEKHIDWSIVASAFPDFDESFIKERWKTLKNQNRKEIQEMTNNLRPRYLIALEQDAVPSVDFENLANTDWKGIVDWATRSLVAVNHASKVYELPASRHMLQKDYELSFPIGMELRDTIGYNLSVSVQKREELASAVLFGVENRGSSGQRSQQALHHGQGQSEVTALSITRTWVLAVLITPADRVDGKKTEDRLLLLAKNYAQSEMLVSQALTGLQQEKVISRISDLVADPVSLTYRTMGTRAWQLSARFYEIFEVRLLVNASMLKRAASYKLDILDEAFRSHDSIDLDKNAIIADGESLAIFNLHSMGLIKIRPGTDVPKSRYGLNWETQGYVTRGVDKKSLLFTVVIVPQKTYIDGDATNPQRNHPIPRGEMDQFRGRIPMWFDINHDFQPRIWEMLLAGMIGLVSIRPGISTVEICKSVNNSVSEFDVNLIMSWASKAGFAEETPYRDGTVKQWHTTEWWWMAVGVGFENGWKWNIRV